MFEIIPNWHPIFVHFTVALFSTSVVFYIMAYIFQYLKIGLGSEFEIVARWCLWVSALVVIGTVLAGLQAYNTVQHDTASHVAMTNHRNWALPTAGLVLLITFWSFWRSYRRRKISIIFIIGLLVVQGMLISTAWRGAELVFRYGLGVMSLPKPEGIEYHHHHDERIETILQPSSGQSQDKHPDHQHTD